MGDVFSFFRYQQEKQERHEALEARQRKEEERLKRQKLEAEANLRDKLIKNVQDLEQRRLEVQRELLLRSLSSESTATQLKSAVVVPTDGGREEH